MGIHVLPTATLLLMSACKGSLISKVGDSSENERLWEKVTEYEQEQTEMCKEMKGMQRRTEILSIWLNVYTTNNSRKLAEMKSTRGESRCIRAKGSKILITRIKQHLKI